MTIGVLLPVLILTVMHYITKDDNTRAVHFPIDQETSEEQTPDNETSIDAPTEASHQPAFIVAFSLLICSAMMFTLIPFNSADSHALLIIFGSVLFALSATIYRFSKSQLRKEKDHHVKG